MIARHSLSLSVLVPVTCKKPRLICRFASCLGFVQRSAIVDLVSRRKSAFFGGPWSSALKLAISWYWHWTASSQCRPNCNSIHNSVSWQLESYEFLMHSRLTSSCDREGRSLTNSQICLILYFQLSFGLQLSKKVQNDRTTWKGLRVIVNLFESRRDHLREEWPINNVACV